MAAAVKVLIVDDDEASLLMLEYMVTTLSLEAVTATDVASAKKALAEHRPQLAILDVMLPDGDGIAILAEIDRLKLPVVAAMLTATHDQTKLYRCNAWKPATIFSKPLDATLVGEWLGQQKARIQLRECNCQIA